MATKKTTTKKKTPRMSASAARADGATKTKRAPADAKRTVDANLKAIAGDDPKDAVKRKATTAVKREPKPAKAKRISGLDLAAKILAASKEPLNAKTIAERAVAAGWKTSGKTPNATLYAAMLREIAAKGKNARFRKTDRGLFASTSGAGGGKVVTA